MRSLGLSRGEGGIRMRDEPQERLRRGLGYIMISYYSLREMGLENIMHLTVNSPFLSSVMGETVT